MFNRHHHHRLPRQRQSGVVLILALIALVALTLAAVALTRSVATSNSIAGNLAFQQAATHSADEGVETAVKWLEDSAVAAGGKSCGGSTPLTCDSAAGGYLASRLDPTATQSWNDFWDATLNAKSTQLPSTSASSKNGNTVSYVIQRMCKSTGEPNTDLNACATSPLATGGSCPGGTTCTGGGGRGGTGSNVNAARQTYYRITVRVSGPRNTQSFVQAMVSL
jgi:type IV pilus assembly protein PilX